MLSSSYSTWHHSSPDVQQRWSRNKTVRKTSQRIVHYMGRLFSWTDNQSLSEARNLDWITLSCSSMIHDPTPAMAEESDAKLAEWWKQMEQVHTPSPFPTLQYKTSKLCWKVAPSSSPGWLQKVNIVQVQTILTKTTDRTSPIRLECC